MPNIYCMTKNCTYNTDGNCSRENVKIGGKEARTPQSTCCDSFIRSHSTMKMEQQPCDCTRIECAAENCTYNSTGRCDASEISVCTCGCDEDACNCSQTECATFKNQKKDK